jgi:hypothetical protein
VKLYTVTIRGFKYYFSCDLTPEGITAIERFCLKLEIDGKSANAATLFERLRNYIASELGLPVTPVKIEHVFRVNY